MKVSAAHQAAIDVSRAAQREALAYHHILQAIAGNSGKWGRLQLAGTVHDRGDSWTWRIAFTPRLRDAVIMETFRSRINQDETVRCFYLADVARSYEGRSFDSQTAEAKVSVRLLPRERDGIGRDEPRSLNAIRPNATY